jgi:hypothetical protein
MSQSTFLSSETCQESAKKKKKNSYIGQGLVIPAHSSYYMKLSFIAVLTVTLVWLAQTDSGLLLFHKLGQMISSSVQFSLTFLYDYSNLFSVTSGYANTGAFMGRGALTVLGSYSST